MLTTFKCSRARRLCIWAQTKISDFFSVRFFAVAFAELQSKFMYLRRWRSSFQRSAGGLVLSLAATLRTMHFVICWNPFGLANFSTSKSNEQRFVNWRIRCSCLSIRNMKTNTNYYERRESIMGRSWEGSIFQFFFSICFECELSSAINCNLKNRCIWLNGGKLCVVCVGVEEKGEMEGKTHRNDMSQCITVVSENKLRH